MRNESESANMYTWYFQFISIERKTFKTNYSIQNLIEFNRRWTMKSCATKWNRLFSIYLNYLNEVFELEERKKIENCNVQSSIIGTWVSETRSLPFYSHPFLSLSLSYTLTESQTHICIQRLKLFFWPLQDHFNVANIRIE